MCGTELAYGATRAGVPHGQALDHTTIRYGRTGHHTLWQYRTAHRKRVAPYATAVPCFTVFFA
eukprot:498843-Rhodomonas_salina.1